jgi:hypothetical protein
LLPSLPPFPTAAAIQHPAAEEGYRAGVELLAGGRVRLARGSFEEFITGAWRSATVRFAIGCGGGRHRRLARCSVEEVITGRCVWIWEFLHLGIRIRTIIWAFIFEFWHLGILNRTNILNNNHSHF